MILLALLLFLSVSVASVFFLRFALTKTGELVGRATHDRHTAAEEILSSGRVPPQWLESYAKRRPGAATSGAYPPEEARYYLKRVDDLARYFRRAPVFDGEETRRVLLEELQAARVRWEAGTWEAAPGDEPAGEESGGGAEPTRPS